MPARSSPPRALPFRMPAWRAEPGRSWPRRSPGGGMGGGCVSTALYHMVVPVRRGSPDGIAGPYVVAGQVRLGMCRGEVACGRYAREVFAAAGVGVPEAGLEGSVRAVLAKVQLGEADAGIVYATDVAAAADVEAVEIGAPGVTATYPAAVIDGSSHAGAAAEIGRASCRERVRQYG